MRDRVAFDLSDSAAGLNLHDEEGVQGVTGSSKVWNDRESCKLLDRIARFTSIDTLPSTHRDFL